MGGALERAFADVEEEVLAHCQEHGTQEGSTALVLLRLGARFEISTGSIGRFIGSWIGDHSGAYRALQRTADIAPEEHQSAPEQCRWKATSIDP